MRHLLTHSAGLHQLRDVISDAYEMLDWDLVCSKLAAQAPRYEPGTRHGYHGITYGFLVGEVIQRVTGMTVHEAVDAEIVKPLALDGMSIGAPPDQPSASPSSSSSSAMRSSPNGWRTARWVPARMRPAIDAFMVPEADRLFASNDVLDSAIPAVNGCFTARSLARMYAALAGGGVLDGERFLSVETLRRATEIHTTGPDIVVGFPMRWRLGYHLAATTRGIIPNGFGHFGFGGSGAWADPDNNLAVAFVCNRVAGRRSVMLDSYESVPKPGPLPRTAERGVVTTARSPRFGSERPWSAEGSDSAMASTSSTTSGTRPGRRRRGRRS